MFQLNSKINVDKEYATDFSYRYKMNSVKLKYQGNGNGLRTVFINLNEIAGDIMRTPNELITYLSSVLGCKYILQTEKNNESKWILFGHYAIEEIQEYVYTFIEHFVLCKHCRNPETHIELIKKNTVLLCEACSKQSNIIPNKHNQKVINCHKKNNILLL